MHSPFFKLILDSKRFSMKRLLSIHRIFKSHTSFISLSQSKPAQLNIQQGFTLIEVMLVVLIAGVFAAMVSLSIGGSQTRKVLQEHDQLVDSIDLIRLESQDQGRMLGLLALDQTATEPARYVVMQFDPNETNKDKRWKPATGFKVHDLPTNVALMITPQQDNTRQMPNARLNEITSNELSPKLIWFGNGEALAARLQLLQDGQPIGDAVEVTTLGRVKQNETRSTNYSNERVQ